MAIDQNPTKADAKSAIDNEIAAYRAISPGAVFSLIFGFFSLFCFTDLWFLILAGMAIVVGLLTIRKIRRYPEILTGVNIARLGIALGLIFALSSVTHVGVTTFMTQREATQFATKYVEVLEKGTLAQAVFYMQPPDYRADKPPEEILEEFQKAAQPGKPDPLRERAEGIMQIKLRLTGPGEHIHFSKIEKQMEEKLSIFANALVRLDGPGSKEFPEKEQFALIEMVKPPGGGQFDWIVKGVTFPYTPSSSSIVIPHGSDDGHGHG